MGGGVQEERFNRIELDIAKILRRVPTNQMITSRNCSGRSRNVTKPRIIDRRRGTGQLVQWQLSLAEARFLARISCSRQFEQHDNGGREERMGVGLHGEIFGNCSRSEDRTGMGRSTDVRHAQPIQQLR
ncbi:hypothetical protein ACLOJK_002112 [Asimina triloba]